MQHTLYPKTYLLYLNLENVSHNVKIVQMCKYDSNRSLIIQLKKRRHSSFGARILSPKCEFNSVNHCYKYIHALQYYIVIFRIVLRNVKNRFLF